MLIRFASQLLREPKRPGRRYGIVTICVGGSQDFALFSEAA